MGDSKIIISVIVGILILGTLGLSQDAYAFSGTLNAATCIFFGWNWDGVDTCTKTTSGDVIAAAQRLTIPSGITLIIANPSGTGITVNQSGSISNSGTIVIANSGSSTGILTSAQIFNDGSIIFQNTGDVGVFITGTGTLFNTPTGTMNLSHSGKFGIVTILGSVVNSGTMSVNQVGIRGITNLNGVFINNDGGEIVFSHSGVDDIGMENSGTANNYGSIIVANSNITFGILNSASGTFNNKSSGSIVVANTGGIGVANAGIFDNGGTVAVVCGSSFDNTLGTYTGDPILDLCDAANLQSFVENSNLATNVEKSLSGPLKKFLKILDDGNPNNDGAACDKLDEFIANVESKEASGKLDSNLAEIFIDSAESIKADIGIC